MVSPRRAKKSKRLVPGRINGLLLDAPTRAVQEGLRNGVHPNAITINTNFLVLSRQFASGIQNNLRRRFWF